MVLPRPCPQPRDARRPPGACSTVYPVGGFVAPPRAGVALSRQFPPLLLYSENTRLARRWRRRPLGCLWQRRAARVRSFGRGEMIRGEGCGSSAPAR